MGIALGVFQGQTTAGAQGNYVNAEFTGTGTVPGVELQTSPNTIPTVTGHFYVITADFGAVDYYGGGVGCNLSDPSLRFSLLDGTTLHTLATGLDPCTAPGNKVITVTSGGDTGNIRVAQLVSSAYQWTGGPSMGIQLYNANGAVGGNDSAFDVPTVVDVTPQLDKSFSPATISSGGVSQLTFVVTNTNELAAKNGWSFTDDLPAGLTATGGNSTTCPSGAVTAGAGAKTVSVAGNLSQGQAACSVTVQVTASAPETYSDGPGNFPAGTAGLNGLNPPGTATLTVTPPASLVIAKQSSTTALTAAGQVLTYKFVVTNRSSVTLDNLRVADTQEPPASQGNMSAVTCAVTTLAPRDSTTCSGTYTVTQADVDHGSLQDSATASGTGPQGGTVTSPPSILTVRLPTPGISVTKSSAMTEATAAGQQVPYSFAVTNTGNVTLTGITVTDTMQPPASPANMSAVTCPQPDLAAGASQTCTGTYTVTQADLNNGSIGDSATASGTGPDGNMVTSPSSPLAIPAQPPGALSVTKATSAAALTGVGQQVPYTFAVTNHSAATVRNITVTDTVAPPSLPANLSAVTCPTTSLAAGASMTCTATYQVTQADLNAGQAADTAHADGTGPAGAPVHSGNSSVTLNLPTATLSIVKATTAPTERAAGQQIPYTFTVTNTGNQTVTNVTVTDTQVPPASQGNMTAVTCPQPTLAPGESETCTGTYTVSQADLDNGSVNDYAVASGKNPSGATVTSPQSSTSVAVPPPALSMVKSSPDDTYNRAGQRVDYAFTVTNNSAVTYAGIQVQDTQQPPATQGNLSAVTCPHPDLTAGASETCTATYTVTQADIDHGALADSATATGTDPAGDAFTTGRSSAILPAAQAPAISMVKSASPSQVHAAGDVITYSFLVTNTGNDTLTGIRVSDAQVVAAGRLSGPVTCPGTSLAPGASVTCTATYTVTQADVDTGTVTDSATATGTPPSGPAVTSAPSAASVSIPPAPALTVAKSTTTVTVTHAGQRVPYSFLVTNAGNVTLTGVTVTDTAAPPSDPAGLSPVTCPVTTLAPRASTTCTATYTVTQADVDEGSVDDSATATGTPPSGPAVTSPPSDASVAVAQGPTLTVAKSTTTVTVTRAGQRVPYSFLVSNTGNVTLTKVAVTDTVAPPSDPAGLTAVTCPGSTLAPGASATCTATYTVTQADVDNGAVVDSATVSGTPPSGPAVTSPASAVSVPVAQSPALTVAKSTTTASVIRVGQRVPYSFLVTNAGNVTLTRVTVTDTVAPPSDPANLSPITCPDTTLAPGISTTCTATYTVTQADVDEDSVDDSATATGTPPSGLAVTSAASDASVAVAQGPALTVAKSTTTASVTRVGQQVPYSFLVANTGNVTMRNVTVTDTVAPPSDPANLSPVTCPDTTLAPGASVTCTATYTVTQADVDHGGLTDAATVTGIPPATQANPSPPPLQQSPPSRTDVPVAQSPALTVVKSAPSAEVSAAGDVMGYAFEVTNTGNVTLANVAVTDAQDAPAGPLDGPVTCPDTTLAPGASTTCTATYTVTQADADNGSVSDTATATGTPPSGPAVTSPPSAAAVPVPAGPAINIVKSATPAQANAAGDVIPYRFTVTNTGTDTLTNVTVTDTANPPSDPANLSPLTCPATTLAPGASVTCTATYTVTQADVDHGSADDTATATGTPPSGPAVTSPAVPLSVPIAANPADTVVKSTTTKSVTHAGQKVPYSFLVTNTGNVTLRDVTVTDTVAAPSYPASLTPVTCPDPALAPGASETCTATYTVTQADIDHGRLGDSATATGTPPATAGNPSPSPLPPSPASAALVPAVQHPGIAVLKTAAKDPLTRVGELIHYAFLVTNTGNVTLRQVGVTDVVAPPADPANLTAVTCPQPTLAPAAAQTCTATYTVTAADLARGSVSNTATAYGTPPSGVVIRSRPHTISFAVTGGPPGPVLIPTGEGANATAPGAGPGLAAAGTAILAAVTVVLMTWGRPRRRRRA
jgi:uncharacterized repeat protein (TIGR01451 family)